MKAVTIYHNPRCSKSRQTLALLEERQVDPEIVLYLETPPDESEIREILRKLGMQARDIIRTGETEYKELGLGNEALSETELIEAIARAPKLLQRPVVVRGDQARIGRPPESVLEIL